MTIEIICPNCNFTRKVPREKIPAGTRWATCPSCKERFEFALFGLTSPFGQDRNGRESEGKGKRAISPWENRFELGLWQGISQTFKAVLFSPEKLFSTMMVGEGIREPLAFGLLLGSIGTMFGFFWQFLIMSGKILSLSGDMIDQSQLKFIFMGIIMISPLLVLLKMFFTGGIIHLSLLILKGGRRGFEGTFRVIAFSQTARILGVIPIVGGIVGSIWHFIVLVIGLKAIHEISYLRVIIALLIPVTFIIILVMAVIIMLSVLF